MSSMCTRSHTQGHEKPADVEVEAWRDASYGLRWIARSCRRRSYWNGYLAEVGHPIAMCGHGLSRRRALLSLEARLRGNEGVQRR